MVQQAAPSQHNPHLTEFVQTVVLTFVHWDLVRFFHDNSYAAESAEHIAQAIGREADTLGTALDSLVSRGVVQVQSVGGRLLYRLSPDETVRERVARFLRACDDRQFRIQIIHHLLRSAR